MSIDLISYSADRREAWDDFVTTAANGTIFHKLDFLSYHGDRFADEIHHVMWLKGDAIIAVLPLAMRSDNGLLVARSPFGASWGGLAHAERFTLDNAVSAVETLLHFLESQGVASCTITMPPPYCWADYTNYAEFALVHHGFKPVTPELTHVVVLAAGVSPMDVHTSSARTQIRKASKIGVRIERDSPLDVVYPLVERTRARLGGRMTHTLNELRMLKEINPAYVKADAARFEGRIVAANIYLHTGRALLSFYPSYDPEFGYTSALSLLIHNAVMWSSERGLRHLDLGCSSYHLDLPNPGVARFKENLGATGFFRTTYEWRRSQ